MTYLSQRGPEIPLKGGICPEILSMYHMNETPITTDFLVIGGGVIFSISPRALKQRLEMDFVLEGDDRSMHVLNAVCPAFTWALPFSEYVCQRIQQVVP